MSVALATMDSAYGLSRLGAISHHHHHHHHHVLRRGYSPEREPEEAQQATLRFSVVNILRPEFGREAILSTRSSPGKTSPIKVTPLPVHSPLSLGPRDLSFSSTRLSPASPSASPSASFGRSLDHQHHHASASSSSRDGFSPVHRPHSSGLSRSGSLESLASSRSSLAGGSATGAGSVSSAASTAGGESLSGDSSASSVTSNQSLWPAWIYCTRYSDRPSSGPRTRRAKRATKESAPSGSSTTTPSSGSEEKRPRTAFSAEQLARLRKEFTENKYLNEQRRQTLSKELGLNEQQIKIWFQNKRAKIKKASGQKNPLALQLMAQGLYNHSTVPVDEDGEELMPGQE